MNSLMSKQDVEFIDYYVRLRQCIVFELADEDWDWFKLVSCQASILELPHGLQSSFMMVRFLKSIKLQMLYAHYSRTINCNGVQNLDYMIRVCVNLSSGLRGLFPILRLTKACWTCPPPRNLTTILKTKLGPTQIRPLLVPTRQALPPPHANRFRVMERQGRPDPWVAPTTNGAVRPPSCAHPVCIR